MSNTIQPTVKTTADTTTSKRYWFEMSKTKKIVLGTATAVVVGLSVVYIWNKSSIDVYVGETVGELTE